MAATKTIWETRDGQRIRVRDMDDSHLVNTVRYLRRRFEKLAEFEALRMMLGPRPRGDIAQMAFDQEIDHLLDPWTVDQLLEDRVVTWPALLAELERRGLEV